jgi:hypothetical protein
MKERKRERDTQKDGQVKKKIVGVSVPIECEER